MVIGWDSKTDTFFISGLKDEEAMSIYAVSFVWRILEKYPNTPMISGNSEIIIKTLKEIESSLHIAQSMKIKGVNYGKEG